MDRAVQIASLAVLLRLVTCTVVGLTYMDALQLFQPKPPLRGEDPCNPLYWYPKPIPQYCNARKQNLPPPPPLRGEDPYPKPIPQYCNARKNLPPPPPPPPPPSPPLPPPPPPMPPPMPMYMPMPAVPLQGLALQMPAPGPVPMVFPYGAPLQFGGAAYGGANILPVPNVPPIAPPIPGLRGLVSPEGAMNILPFTDVYSNTLEAHKQKIIRRRLESLLDEYERYRPNRNNRGRRRYHIH